MRLRKKLIQRRLRDPCVAFSPSAVSLWAWTVTRSPRHFVVSSAVVRQAAVLTPPLLCLHRRRAVVVQTLRIHAAFTRAILKGKKKCSVTQSSQKSPQVLHVGGWRMAVGGDWRLAVGGGWWLAIGGWWWLVVGGWWRLAAAGGWWLVAVGGWRLVAVDGWRRLAVGGGWRRLVVGGWWTLRAVLSQKKKGSLRTALAFTFVGSPAPGVAPALQRPPCHAFRVRKRKEETRKGYHKIVGPSKRQLELACHRIIRLCVRLRIHLLRQGSLQDAVQDLGRVACTKATAW